MSYRVVSGAVLSEGGVRLVGPCPLTFGTPAQVEFWLRCGAIEPEPVKSEPVKPAGKKGA